MSIAIIIPAKNEQIALPKLLKSLAAQTEKPDEVIIMNSHSTDHTVERAKSFANKLPIRVYDAKVKGATAARNEGAKKATADYLVFIDSDVILSPNFIETMRQTIATNKKIDIGAFRQVIDSDQFGLKFGGNMMNVYVRLMAKTPWPIFFSCFFIKRKLFEKIDGFDQEIFIMEDYDLALRGHRAGGKFGVVKGTYFYASPRRYEATDGGRSIANGFYAELYRYTHGLRITKPLFEYKMGGDQTGKKQKS